MMMDQNNTQSEAVFRLGPIVLYPFSSPPLASFHISGFILCPNMLAYVHSSVPSVVMCTELHTKKKPLASTARPRLLQCISALVWNTSTDSGVGFITVPDHLSRPGPCGVGH